MSTELEQTEELIEGVNARYCTCCKELKHFNDFSKMKGGKYGLAANCKLCNNAKCRARYAEDPEKKQAQNKAWLELHKEEASEYQKQWRKENEVRLKERSKRYYAENAEAERARLNKWKLENFERYKQAAAEYYQANKEDINARISKNRKENSHIYAEHCRRYFAKRKLGTSSKLTEKDLRDIKDFYALAKALTKATDEKWQVDHIVPLKHDLVCGLHVPWNLQVITAKENIIKSNKFTVG